MMFAYDSPVSLEDAENLRIEILELIDYVANQISRPTAAGPFFLIPRLGGSPPEICNVQQTLTRIGILIGALANIYHLGRQSGSEYFYRTAEPIDQAVRLASRLFTMKFPPGIWSATPTYFEVDEFKMARMTDDLLDLLGHIRGILVHVPEIELDIPIIVISVEACCKCEQHAIASANADAAMRQIGPHQPKLFTMLTAACEHWNRFDTPRFLYQHPKPTQSQVLARERAALHAPLAAEYAARRRAARQRRAVRNARDARIRNAAAELQQLSA